MGGFLGGLGFEGPPGLLLGLIWGGGQVLDAF
jgi:hypothetical protein